MRLQDSKKVGLGLGPLSGLKVDRAELPPSAWGGVLGNGGD